MGGVRPQAKADKLERVAASVRGLDFATLMNGSHARLAVSAAGFVSGGLHAPSRNSGQRHLGSGLAGVELICPTPAGLNSTPPTALPRIENAFASWRRETLDTPILFSGCILATPRAKRKSSCPSTSDVSANKNSPLMFVMTRKHQVFSLGAGVRARSAHLFRPRPVRLRQREDRPMLPGVSLPTGEVTGVCARGPRAVRQWPARD